METIKEVIKDTILRARQFHFDGKEPSTDSIEKLEEECFEKINQFYAEKIYSVQHILSLEYDNNIEDAIKALQELYEYREQFRVY